MPEILHYSTPRRIYSHSGTLAIIMAAAGAAGICFGWYQLGGNRSAIMVGGDFILSWLCAIVAIAATMDVLMSEGKIIMPIIMALFLVFFMLPGLGMAVVIMIEGMR